MFKANVFQDKRLGVKDHRTKTEREDHFSRIKKAGRTKQKKISLFNLDSEDEKQLQLTHDGQKIEDIDDFEKNEILFSNLACDEEEVKLEKEFVRKYNFSGGNMINQKEEKATKGQKSLKQIYAEIIEKRRVRKKEHEKYLEEVRLKTIELNEKLPALKQFLSKNRLWYDRNAD